ncbi:MAG: DUF3473 domain-containing protein [Magnetococcales bacterium]|nr:DUF3473 domain-containing protein [Magnetococcales bacterium]
MSHKDLSVPNSTEAPDRIVNAFTVDVEDYYQVSAFEKHIDRSQWPQWPSRVEANTERLLQLCDDHGVQGSFFILGCVAERSPQLVRRIAEAGHEIASHGYAHIRVSDQTPDQFLEDVSRTRHILEEISGQPVIGYRAASYSIDARSLWALSLLHRAGYRYSSSIYPIHHDHYGMREAPRFPFRLQSGEGGTEPCVPELPITTLEVGNRRLPCGGGGWFRLLPFAVHAWMFNRILRSDHHPGLFYCHPWELDADQPRVPDLPAKTRFRHYVNLSRMPHKIDQLLGAFRWSRMDRVFRSVIERAASSSDGGCVDK